MSKDNDLITLEFVKEARILKRQIQLMKNNIDKIEIEDLIKILTVSEVVIKEFNELKKNSEVKLLADGWEIHKHM